MKGLLFIRGVLIRVVLPTRAALGFWAVSISCGRRGTFCMLLKHTKTLAGGGQNESVVSEVVFDFFVWQAQQIIYYLVHLDDVLEGSNISFSEPAVIFDIGHEDSAWQVQHFGCLGWQCFVKIYHVLAQASRHFGRVGSLSLWHRAQWCSFR